MSLINDALKKAQMEGGGKAAPAVRNPDVASAALGARRPKFARVAVLGVAVIAVAGGVGYYVLAPDASTPVVAVASAPKVAPVTPGVAPKRSENVAPVAKKETAAATSAGPSSPAESATDVASAPAVAPASASVAPAVVASPAPTVPPVAVAPAGPVRNPDVDEAIDRMHLSLVKKKTGRCVIDGGVHKTGDRVSEHPEINIKDITDFAVIFSDGNGVEYEKKYK